MKVLVGQLTAKTISRPRTFIDTRNAVEGPCDLTWDRRHVASLVTVKEHVRQLVYRITRSAHHMRCQGIGLRWHPQCQHHPGN